MKLPVLHADWDTPVVLVPLAEILAGESCDGIEWSMPDDDCEADYRGPKTKRNDYEGRFAATATNGYCASWVEWLDQLSTVGLRNPVRWDPWEGLLGNGHHRVCAAMDLGWTHIPVVISGEQADQVIFGFVNHLDALRMTTRPLSSQ